MEHSHNKFYNDFMIVLLNNRCYKKNRSWLSEQLDANSFGFGRIRPDGRRSMNSIHLLFPLFMLNEASRLAEFLIVPKCSASVQKSHLFIVIIFPFINTTTTYASYLHSPGINRITKLKVRPANFRLFVRPCPANLFSSDFCLITSNTTWNKN